MTGFEIGVIVCLAIITVCQMVRCVQGDDSQEYCEPKPAKEEKLIQSLTDRAINKIEKALKEIK